VPVTAEPPFEVHTFAVRASAFGHNAPLEPVRSDGVITDTKEWDLQVPGPNVTKSFTLTLSEENDGTSVKASIGNESSIVQPIEQNEAELKLPTERIKVSRKQDANHRTSVTFVFVKGNFSVQLDIDGVKASSPHPQVTVTASRNDKTIVVSGRLPSPG